MSKKRSLLQAMVEAERAHIVCEANGSRAWSLRWLDYLTSLEKLLPSGSGYDNGSKIESVCSTRAVFKTSFHHMDANGFYDGWTDHMVSVIATFDGIEISSISGKNRNGIKDHITDTFLQHLAQDAPEYPKEWEGKL